MNASPRPHAPAISRRKVLAALAAPFAAPLVLVAASIIRPGASQTRAQAGPAPAIAPLIRAHQTALLFPPQFSSGKTRFALSVEGGDGALLWLPSGQRHTVRLVNELPQAIIPRLRGIGSIAANAIAPGAFADLAWDGLRAGTHLLELRGLQTARLVAESRTTNAVWPVLPLIVAPPYGMAGFAAVTNDEVLLIEEWPVPDAGLDGGAGDSGKSSLPPGKETQPRANTGAAAGLGAGADLGAGLNAGAGMPVALTANRLPRAYLAAPMGGTLRLRLIIATPRRMLSFLLPDLSPSVIAIDGEDSEPFTPKDRQIVLAPGNRMDVLLTVPYGATQAATAPILIHDGIRARTIAQIRIDAADAMTGGKQPNPSPASPSTGTQAAASPAVMAAPDPPSLTGAQRFDLAFTPPASGSAASADSWRMEGAPAPASPAFTATKGRTVSLALRNDFSAPVVFHLSGHHARLLDRLDDGWKPFWLDTIAAEPNETIRLAFVAPNTGIWDIEATVLAESGTSAPAAAATPPSSGDTNAWAPFRFLARFAVT